MLCSLMPRIPKHAKHQASIRTLLAELGHTVVLRDEPQPSVFLDHEPSARFYGLTWLLVYADVLAHFTSAIKTVKPKTLAHE